MNNTWRILKITVSMTVLLLAGCMSGRIPSVKDVIKKGPEWTETSIEKLSEEELIEAWGEPDERTEAGVSGTMTWFTAKGTVVIGHDAEGLHIVSAEEPVAEINTEGQNGLVTALEAVLAAALPFILIFAAVILLFRKLGWLDAGEPDKKSAFFAKERGSKPWSGI